MPTFLRLTWTNQISSDGFKALELALVQGAKVTETIPCISGVPSRQSEPFVQPKDDYAGSLRPIPEGVYAIGDIRTGNFEAGIGDTFIPLTVLPPYQVNNRSAFGFHMDANQATAPGSAGCVVFSAKADLVQLESWLTGADPPKTLVVDWKLGFLSAKGYEDFDHDTLADQASPAPSQAGAQGLALIKHFEGLRLEAYPDPASGGVPWTIGYGHTAGVRPGDEISQAEADAMLVADLRVAETSVRRLVKVALSQNQFDALTSFEFNLASLATSTLLRVLNGGDYHGAADQILRWDKATINGVLQPMPGLTRRRRSERHLFLNNELLYNL
jgi:lysozyme